jgi:GST-like protein
MPKETGARYQVIQWLMFQMGGVGPMIGQTHYFLRNCPEDQPFGRDRFMTETVRLYRVLDKRLGEAPYLAGEYSIADIATYPWIARYEMHRTHLEDYPNVKRWFDAIGAREAVKRGMQIPKG